MDPKYDMNIGGEEEYAVRDVSFHIKPGQMCALVGRSGAGKRYIYPKSNASSLWYTSFRLTFVVVHCPCSTLSLLLPRLYDVNEGRVLIDDHDIRDIDLDNLAQHIGIVTQDVFLFHDSIRANLLFAKPTASDAEIEAACRVANIWEKIKSLPEGLDTMVGERGFKLSGGVRKFSFFVFT
jgi:ATP-binding cassette subfamily B protein